MSESGTMVMETGSSRLVPVYLVTVQAPEAEIDTIMEQVVAADSLTIGSYDRCAFQSAAGIERYRTREGAVAGAEETLRKRPGVAEVSFQIARDDAVLAAVLDAIARVHGYQEPVILVQPVLATRSKDGGRDNPNRWWNKGGDWAREQPEGKVRTS